MNRFTKGFGKVFSRPRASRPPSDIERVIVELVQDFARDKDLEVIPQTQVVESHDKFSACLVLKLQDPTGHRRNELNLAVVVSRSAKEPSLGAFDPQHPLLFRLLIPGGYDYATNRNALYGFLDAKLTELTKGLWREINTYLFFLKNRTFTSAGDEWVTVNSVRYATPEEDQVEGFDLALGLTTLYGSHEVRLQVTGGYKDGKEYGKIGLVRYVPGESEPADHQVAAFLLNLWRGKEGQEIYFPQ